MTRSPVKALPAAALAAAAGRLVTVPLAARRTFGTRTALAPDAAAVGSVVAIGCQRLAARIPNAGVVAGGHSARRPSGRLVGRARRRLLSLSKSMLSKFCS